MGHANFSPARISTVPSQFQEQLTIAIHEISHALGFSSAKYDSFIDPTSGAGLPRSSVVLQYSDIELGNKTVAKIITPKVVSKVKEHFGCDNWPNAGAELEDFGDAGTAYSHWYAARTALL
jgi:hypothetical protein